MIEPRLNLSRFWPLVLVAGLAFLIWLNAARVRRVDAVSQLAGRAEVTDILDRGSATGYSNGQRELIVPERNEESFHWIAETQQMLARREWRVRNIDYENAPRGRTVRTPSLYRWWLGTIAWLDHAATGRPLGLSVEYAARWADPVLQILLLFGGACFTARRFGATAAVVLAVGLAATFPFSAGFLPGAPNSAALAQCLQFASILLLLAGLSETPLKPTRWFVAAAVVAALALWVDVALSVPVIGSIALGALLVAAFSWNRADDGNARDLLAHAWRVWGITGAAITLVAYLVEYFPSNLSEWDFDHIHPIYGVAWWGLGEVIAWIVAGSHRPPASGRVSYLARAIFGVVSLASLPIAMKLAHARGFLSLDLAALRLSNQPGGIIATSLWDWVARDGATGAVTTTLLLLLAFLPAVWVLLRTEQRHVRRAVAFSFGPVLVAVGFATQRLSWWGMADTAVLGMSVVTVSLPTPGNRHLLRWGAVAVVILAALFGVRELVPTKFESNAVALTAREAQELVERHLAHWLAKHAGTPGAIVFAPPHQSTSLAFYGGLRGLGTFASENKIGFGVTLNIAGANTIDEAQTQLQQRGVRYIVIPSWDPFFDEFAGLYLSKQFSGRRSALITTLRQFNLPPWVRALPYQLPEIAGFEGQSVLVLEIVDEQNPALANARLAEYFVELGQLDRALATAEYLRRFPGDLGSLVARFQVQSARSDTGAVAQTLEQLQLRLANGGDRFLAWDRRVSLAIVLGRANRIDASREQTKRCAADVTDERLRTLTPASLYGLLVLSQTFEVTWPNPGLRSTALALLPPELREGL